MSSLVVTYRFDNSALPVVITPTQLEWLKRYSSRGIAVDDTHNITRYNLKLATVSVADHKDRGLPAGDNSIGATIVQYTTRFSFHAEWNHDNIRCPKVIH